MNDQDDPANLLGHLSALNQVDTKEELAADLDTVLDISPQPDDTELEAAEGEGATSEVHKLSERLAASETKKTKLKHLLANLLDLIQQQNETISEKDKRNKALKLENDSLKSKVNRIQRRITQERRMSQRRNVTIDPTPANNVPPPNDPGTSTRDEATDDDNLMLFNSLTDLLIPDDGTNPYNIFYF